MALQASTSVLDAAVEAFQRMQEDKVVPYRNIPPRRGGPPVDKAVEEIQKLGRVYFPSCPHSFELALALYDWTSPGFFRIDILSYFTYTGLQDQPIDLVSIVDMIWHADWKPFSHEDKDFMRSLLMRPVESWEGVQMQANKVIGKLREYNAAERALIQHALSVLPRVRVDERPFLYMGAPDINSLGLDRFCAHFHELPANSGPVGRPLSLPFRVATNTAVKSEHVVTPAMLQSGRIVTTKCFWPCTYLEDAVDYAGPTGFLVRVLPPLAAVDWPSLAYVTPLSCEADKCEYLFQHGTRFASERWAFEKVSDKGSVLVWTVRVVSARVENDS